MSRQRGSSVSIQSSPSGSEYEESADSDSDAFAAPSVRSRSSANSTSRSQTSSIGDEISNDGQDVVLQHDREAKQFYPRGLPHGPRFSNLDLVRRRLYLKDEGWHRLRLKYCSIFNSVVEDLTKATQDPQPDFLPSTLGVSHWTATEKQVLFKRLDAIGRTNVKNLAISVGTKNESEVRQYLNLLTQGSVENHLRGRRFGVDQDEIPAAIEIDQPCERGLEKAADNLSWKVNLLDIEREKAIFDRFWLLDSQVAVELETLLKDRPENQDDNAVPEQAPLPVPAADMFHLGNWLELSRMFMSSSADHETDWTDFITTNEEEPAIFNTAFSDFYNLAVTLTKKLMQAALWQAMSRLRATDRNRPDHVVRHQDVQAACRTLGMSHDWREYWVHAPRRLGLQVWTRSKQMNTSNTISSAVILEYDQVEAYLDSTKDDDDDAVDLDIEKIVPSVEHESDDVLSISSDDPDFWTDASTSSEDDTIVEVSDGPQMVVHEDMSVQEEKADAEDHVSVSSASPERILSDFKAETAYLEAFDAYASRRENERLRAMLAKRTISKKQTDNVKGADDSDHAYDAGDDEQVEPKDEDLAATGDNDGMPPLPPLPAKKRKRLAEIEDWREKVTYVPEWEAFSDGPPDASAFVAMGKRGEKGKRRRVAWKERMQQQHQSES